MAGDATATIDVDSTERNSAVATTPKLNHAPRGGGDTETDIAGFYTKR